MQRHRPARALQQRRVFARRGDEEYLGESVTMAQHMLHIEGGRGGTEQMVVERGNLDPALSLDIMNLFRRFNDIGVTMMIATHDLSLLDELGGRRIELKQGELIGDSKSPVSA